jgi:hypothetical protein
MGRYVSVRGWIEVDVDTLPRVKQLVQEFPNTPGDEILTPEQVRLYAQGWVIAEDGPNWTKYCFYGADIRQESLAYLLTQIRAIAQAVVEADERQREVAGRYQGVFFVDDDEDEISLVWYIKDGEIIEKTHVSVA